MPKETFQNLEQEKKNRILEAAINEFSEQTYESAKISNIIKEAKIPRGSFYQYFEDKFDLYNFIFDYIGNQKMEFMKDLLPNPENMGFLELFEELYIRGVKFAKSDPRYVKISTFLMSGPSNLLKKVFDDKLDYAKQIYIDYVNADKALGRIREEIDSETLANLLIQVTTNIAVEEVKDGKEIDLNHMLDKIKKFILILKKGIE